VWGNFSEKAKIRYEITVENSSPLLLNAFTKERSERKYRRRVSRSVGEKEREREVREYNEALCEREKEREKYKHMPPIAPPDEVLAKIKTLVEYVVNHGADKEQIARESIEKNKFDFLSARRDSIGFVCYEYMKGEKLRVRREERDAKRREEREGKEEDGGGGGKKRKVESEENNARAHTNNHNHRSSGGSTDRPNMKIAILDVVKKHLQPFYSNKDVSKEAYKNICKKTCEKVMSKEPQVEDDEEKVKEWLDERVKKKIRGLVETFVEMERGGSGR